MGWITLDENGKEYVTKVHQVECRYQEFNPKKKQFICSRDFEECCETCPSYYNLKAYTDEDTNPPTICIEEGTRVMMKDTDRQEQAANEDLLGLEDDFILLDYLKKEIW